MAEDLQQSILSQLSRANIDDSFEYAQSHGISHEVVMGALRSLSDESQQFVSIEPLPPRTLHTLTEEGQAVLEEGSPEYRLYTFVKTVSGEVAEIDAQLGAQIRKFGMGACVKGKFLSVEGTTLKVGLAMDADQLREQLSRLNQLSPQELTDLKKRKMITQSVIRGVSVIKGARYDMRHLGRQKVQLTTDDIASGAWKTTEYRKTNWDTFTPSESAGHLHPLMKYRSEIRDILVAMGFQEMETARFAQSSFWNFDALFQPQQHPARDAQDTFFLSHPASAPADDAPTQYFEEVRQTHQSGGYGSLGWRYDWSPEEAQKYVMRTHTTADSARHLFELGQEFLKTGVFTPKKYFSIDRVFRNESLDATHLAEFHQIEGLVAGYDLSLCDLIGIIKEFFVRIGVPDVRFKPAYNPYTEPSMEIFGFLPTLNKWVEVGNSGSFRPEMLRPMGLPENVVVLAWGLSLERPTMKHYELDNIRDLIGHKMDLNMVKANPLCVFPE